MRRYALYRVPVLVYVYIVFRATLSAETCVGSLSFPLPIRDPPLPPAVYASLWIHRCRSFYFSVGVVLRRHPRGPEGGGRLSDVVPAQGGARPHEGRAPPGARDLLVHRRNRPAVRHRPRPSRDAQELLQREERLRGGRHLELVVSICTSGRTRWRRGNTCVWRLAHTHTHTHTLSYFQQTFLLKRG